jgi:hypothetical protein
VKAVDLCCGLGGWTEGLLAEGYDVRGYDIEEHVYGDERYPAELVLKNIHDVHGSECADANLIVASPVCTEFSYMAMPWKRAKQIGRALRGEDEFPDGYTGSRTIEELTALFDACFRIQREASEARGERIPMVVENVLGAQPWLGKAQGHYGSYYLWGDVPPFLPPLVKAVKIPGFRFDGSGRSFQTASVQEGRKHHSDWFRDPACPSRQGGQIKPRLKKDGQRDAHTVDANFEPAEGRKGSGYAWFKKGTAAWSRDPISRAGSANSPARKAASAKIAKIPLALSRHVGAYWALFA